jgi:acetolactate synthase-1/2/3 large subunit
MSSLPARLVASEYLCALAHAEVDYLFVNAGTDFAPIAEAYALAAENGEKVPAPVIVPHESVAVAMASGFALVTGRPQAVMVHVGNGTANAVNNLFNASRQRVPMLMTAGRTPVLEHGTPASRNNFIHWAQELFDQGGMVRELVKWDYELRHPLQVRSVVERAMSLARSAPQGPVYVVLPREVLAAPCDPQDLAPFRPVVPATPPQADTEALVRLSGWLREARQPLIVTADAGRSADAFDALSRLADRLAIAVVEYRPRVASLPSDHPMHAGFDASALLPDADLVIVVDCDVPWLPSCAQPPSNARVVHLGVDPLYERYPMRSFPADLAIAGDAGGALRRLDELTGTLSPAAQAVCDERRRQLAEAHAARRRHRRSTPAGRMSASWVTRCIDDLRDDDTVLVNEYPLLSEDLTHRRAHTFFALSPAGGLGWATGAALGIKLARPDSTVIAAVGDGAYLFGNPTPTHMVGRALGLPVLWVVFNNHRWAAVHQATRSVFPDGAAVRASVPPLTMLEPAPDYERLVEAVGGYGERVEQADGLPAALQRALRVVRDEGRQAVLNVILAD